MDVVALNLGFQPETGLARALGAKQRFVDVGLGHLASETDEDGRTVGARRVRGRRWRIARRIARRDGAWPAGGLAAARDLGMQVPDEPATRTALARAVAFQDALWTLFQPIRLRPGTLPTKPSSAAARKSPPGGCAGELADGLTSLPALKKATRAGMGRCQGRFCAATIARLCPDAAG